MQIKLVMLFFGLLVVGIGLLSFCTHKIVAYYSKSITEKTDNNLNQVVKLLIAFNIIFVYCLVVVFVEAVLLFTLRYKVLFA
jgi:hypothetical protein